MSSPGFSFSQAHLAEIATDILKHAKKHGASACETDVSEGFGQSVAVRKGEVDMEINDVLEPSDLDEGLILACQALPVSDSVEVTYDE